MAEAVAIDPSVPHNRDENWKRLVNQLESYGFILHGETIDIGADLNGCYYQIDKRFQFKLEEHPFRYQQIDGLLSQVASLLERAIATRTSWNEAAVQMFGLGQSLSEFALLDKIHEDEREAGYYTKDRDEAELLSKAERENKIAANEALSKVAEILQSHFNPTVVDRIRSLNLCRAIMSAFPTFSKDHQPPEHPYTDPRLPAGSWTKAQINQMVEEEPANRLMAIDVAMAQLQFILSNGDAHTADHKAAAAQKAYEWQTANSEFQWRRTQVSRNLAAKKLQAAVEVNGVLNYPERMKQLELRFLRDFNEALNKIIVADEGLKKLFKYQGDLPRELKEVINGKEAEPGIFDAALVWVLNASEWMGRVVLSDQTSIWPLSIRSLMSSKDWKKAVSTGHFEFELTDKNFPRSAILTRLRGMSLYVDTEVKDIWKATIVLPTETKISYADNTTAKIQQHLPPCIIGRAKAPMDQHDADISGVSSLRNASPLGKWKIDLEDSVFGQEKTKIKDILIELHICFQIADNRGVANEP